MVYGNITAESLEARGERTTETNNYSEANMLLFSSVGNKGKFHVSANSASLRLIIVAL